MDAQTICQGSKGEVMNINFRCRNKECPEFEVSKAKADYAFYMKSVSFDQGKCLQCGEMLVPDALPPRGQLANKENIRDLRVKASMMRDDAESATTLEDARKALLNWASLEDEMADALYKKE